VFDGFPNSLFKIYDFNKCLKNAHCLLGYNTHNLYALLSCNSKFIIRDIFHNSTCDLLSSESCTGVFFSDLNLADSVWLKVLPIVLKGVVHLKKKKTFADNFLTPMSSEISKSFFLQLKRN